MIEISKYFNGNKKAVVYKTEMEDFIVELYLNDKIIQKRNAFNSQYAEDLAEDYVLGQGPNTQLLNENA